MLEQKDNILSLSAGKNGGATLLKNDDFRIDYQGYFHSPAPYEIGWINLQVQENTPRKSNASTTVITTYVHYQGYHEPPGRITGNIVLRAMIQQAMHIIGELSVFVSKSQAGAIVVQNIPRSPQGLLKHGWGSLEEAKEIQGLKKWNNPKMKGKWASIWVPGS
ncbi:hypothetical protein ACN38_g6858 [Penicillium nordicum]|uniref:Uncharacterized protein n=1 Tax=Penicillium nordicum TaxID=229535 RepID=A0A0M8P7H2_9EURO|nr:hypothetical protein ACN38_g6858 [Penicillium nordicum]